MEISRKAVGPEEFVITSKSKIVAHDPLDNILDHIPEFKIDFSSENGLMEGQRKIQEWLNKNTPGYLAILDAKSNECKILIHVRTLIISKGYA